MNAPHRNNTCQAQSEGKPAPKPSNSYGAYDIAAGIWSQEHAQTNTLTLQLNMGKTSANAASANVGEALNKALTKTGATTEKATTQSASPQVESGKGAQGSQTATGAGAGQATGGNVGGRQKNYLKPDPNATGDHTTFRRNEEEKVTTTQEWKTNPKNPSGFDSVKRVDTQHSSEHTHVNKATGDEVSTPHVHDKTVPGNVRPADPSELPR